MSSINVTMTPEEFEQWRDSVKLLAQANEQVERERKNYKSAVDRLTRYENSLDDAVISKKEAESSLQKERVIHHETAGKLRDAHIVIQQYEITLEMANKRKWYQFVGVRNV